MAVLLHQHSVVTTSGDAPQCPLQALQFGQQFGQCNIHMTEAGGRDKILIQHDRRCCITGVVFRDEPCDRACGTYDKWAYAVSIRDEIRNIQHALRRFGSPGSDTSAPWTRAKAVRTAQLGLVTSSIDHMRDPSTTQPRYIHMTEIGGDNALLGMYDRYFGIMGVVTMQ